MIIINKLSNGSYSVNNRVAALDEDLSKSELNALKQHILLKSKVAIERSVFPDKKEDFNTIVKHHQRGLK